MHHPRIRKTLTPLIVILLSGTFGLAAQDETASSIPIQEKTNMTESATPRVAQGPFDVQLTPQSPDEGHQDSGIGRMLLDKTFHGDLEGSSLGQMLAFRSPVDGSAGYVAMEHITGTLHGRSGSFVVQHSATMAGGAQYQDLRIVPDSGTDELAGLTGSMTLVIEEGGKHFYELEYTLP